jgi:molybdenum cofactor biosynthesis protein B
VHVELEHIGPAFQRSFEAPQRVLHVLTRRASVSKQQRSLRGKAFHATSIHSDSIQSIGYAPGMPGIDEERPFIAVHIAVLTISDTRTEATDSSGQLLIDRATAAGHHVVARRIIPDEQARIEAALRELVADPGVDIILATGGTGVTGRDVTPEAFQAVIEKEIPGFGELFRYLSYASIGTSTIQSRALAGVARGTYLFALPGSTGACKDAWDQILAFQLDNRYRPCNFVELLPRLREA